MPRGRPKGSKNNTVQKYLAKLQPEDKQRIKETTEETNLEIIERDTEEKKDISIPPQKPTKEQEERMKKAKNVMREINNKGEGKIIINFANTFPIRERQSFGYKCLDDLTGGGIPRGLFSTIWGSKGCAKTSVALKMVATAQKEGKIVAWIDAEHSYDGEWASLFGVNPETLIYEKTETAEQALDSIIKLCREKVCDLIILDSIHSLCPKGQLYEGKGEKEKSLDKNTEALRARKLTQFFEMSIHPVSEAKCAVLLIAQSRVDLSAFIKIETLTGGHALLHNSRVILKFRRGQMADAPGEEIITDEQDKDKDGNLKFNKKTGEPIYIKDKIITGFPLVVHVDKSQVQGCVERHEINVPFLYENGIKE